MQCDGNNRAKAMPPGVFLPFVLLMMLIPSRFVWGAPQTSLACTVDNTGFIPVPDFVDLQAALDGCRMGNITNITLLVLGSYSPGPGGLVFPGDVQNLTIQSAGGYPQNVTIAGSCYQSTNGDPRSRYPALNFVNVTFDMQAGNSSLFCPQLTNQNFSMTGSIVKNVAPQSSTVCPSVTQFVSCRYTIVSPVDPTATSPPFPPPDFPGLPPAVIGFLTYNYTFSVADTPLAPNATAFSNGTALCPPINDVFRPEVLGFCDWLDGGDAFTVLGTGNVTTVGESVAVVDLAAAYSDVTLLNVSFDGINSDLPSGPRDCAFGYTIDVQVAAPYQLCYPSPTLYWLKGEACYDQVYLTLKNNTFEGVPNGLVYWEGLEQFDLRLNNMPSTGDNVTANSSLIHLRVSDVSVAPVHHLVQNDQWRCFQCRGIRCLYAIFDNTYEYQCNNGALQCLDRARMNLQRSRFPDLCPVGNWQVFDEYTNRTVTVTNDYNPECSRYIACPCNYVKFLNVTSQQTISLPVGNIKLKNGQILPCVPAPGVPTVPIPADITYVGVTNVFIGDPFAQPPVGIPSNVFEALTPDANGTFILFPQGIIVDPDTGTNTCPCNHTGRFSQRDQIATPCEYLVISNATLNTTSTVNDTVVHAIDNSTLAYLESAFSIYAGAPQPNITWQNQTLTIPFDPASLAPSFCQEGDLFCCQPPDVVSVIYKTDCSLSPTECVPAVFPNGTLVNPFTNTYYDCEYLANCSYADGGITGCVPFRCGLLECLNCVEYDVNSTCWDALNLGTSLERVTMTVAASFGLVPLTIKLDSSQAVANATFSAPSIVTSLGDFDVSITIVNGLITASEGTLTVCTLVGGTLDDLELANATLSNGTFVSHIVISGGVVITPASGLAGATISQGNVVAGGSFSAPYPQCNDLLQATTDPMCLFARDNCSRFYDGNYPIAGYAVAGTALPSWDTTTVLLSPTCSFDPDECVYFNDTRCVCSDCTLSSCRLGTEYDNASACFQALDIGTARQYIEMEFVNASIASMTFDGSGKVVDALMFGPVSTATGAVFVTVQQISGSIVLATLFAGTSPVYTLLDGWLNNATVVNATKPDASVVSFDITDQIASGGLASTTISSGFVTLGFYRAPYPLCNDLTQDTADPLCLFLRDDCLQYYDPDTGLLLSPSNLTLPTLCPAVANPAKPVAFNYSASFRNVTPPACEFVPRNCMSYLLQRADASFDDRCNCTDVTALDLACAFDNATNATVCTPPVPTTGFVDFDLVLGSIVTSDLGLLPPSKRPRTILPRLIDPGLIPCVTDLWYQCNCPPYFTNTSVVNVCLATNSSSSAPLKSFTNATCTSFATMTVGECLATPGCLLPDLPANFSVYLNGTGLSCSTGDDNLHCDCGSTLAGKLCPPQVGTVVYDIGNIPAASDLQVIDNSACFFWNGMKVKQMTVDSVNRISIEPQPWYDEYSLVRNIAVQKNEFLVGVQGDIVQNEFGTPYRRECTEGCASDYRAPTTADRFQCVVDASADKSLPGYGITYFSSLYQVTQAIEKGACQENKTVLVLYTQQYYNEPEDFVSNPEDEIQLVFGPGCDGFLFASLDGAVVVGDDFGIDTSVTNITFVGLTFIHGGDTGVALFTAFNPGLFSYIGLLTFYDCAFIGGGARGAGMIDILRIYNLDVRYCLFSNWNYFAIRVLDLDRFTFYDNTVVQCQGRCIQVRYNQFVRFDGNAFIECRGGSGLTGPSIVFLRGSNEASCVSENTFQSVGIDLGFGDLELSFGSSFLCAFTGSGCPKDQTQVDLVAVGAGLATPAPLSMLSMTSNWTRLIPASEQFKCSVRRNYNFIDVTAADFTDTFITLSGSSISPREVQDNGVLKMQYGMAFLFTPNIQSPSDQDLLARFNPLVRPHLFRAIDPRNRVFAGADFRGWGFSSGVFSFFSFLFQVDQFACNWPCNQTVANGLMKRNLTFGRCEVNNNWDVETMPVYDDANLVPRYGYLRWHNISQAVLHCEDGNVEAGLPMPLIYVTSFNGSRFYFDNITMARDGWVIGDTSDPTTWCTLAKGYRPCSRGNGNTCAAGRCRLTDMCFELSESQIGENLWQDGAANGANGAIPYDVEIYNCVFDGRNLPLRATSLALSFDVGGLHVPNERIDLNQNPLNTLLPPLSNGTFIMYNSSVQNFTSFIPKQVIDPVNQQVGNVELKSFPYTSGVQVEFVNVFNTNTTCVIVNNTFYNIDRTPVALLRAINITITDNSMYNVSGRSIGNIAGFYVEGNPFFSTRFGVSQVDVPGAVNGTYPKARIVIERNYMDQNKTVLTPFDNRKANLVRLVSMWIRMLPDPENAVFCFRNNSVRDLPIGVRFSDFNQSLLATCLTPPNKVYFPDILRFLRAVALEHQCVPRNDTNVTNNGVPIPPPPALSPGQYGINGTFHDFENSFADAHLELYDNVLYCDACCPPAPPTICYVEPPGVDPLFVPDHPWWHIYLFDSIVDCIHLCNATVRQCYALGQATDPIGSFLLQGQRIPFKVYTETIDTTVTPPLNVNQSNKLVINGEPGLVICSPLPHRLDNPLGLLVTIEGLNFTHCDGASPDWDWTDPGYSSQSITLNGNLFNGTGTTAMVVDGTFDDNFAYIGNYMSGYKGPKGARFRGRSCTNHIRINLNTFVGFHGNNVEVIGFDYIAVGDGLPGGNNKYNNKFLDAGGDSALVPPSERYVVFVSTCNDGRPGLVTLSGNLVVGNPNVACGTGSSPLWTAYYVSPVPWKLKSFYTIVNPLIDTKDFDFRSLAADGTLCIGMRLDQTTFNCFAADRQGYLREDIYYPFSEGNLKGQEPPLGFWLYIGPFNAAQENAILLAPDVDPGNICRHCENGCFRDTWDLLGWILGGSLLALIFLCCFCWFACGGACFCCPKAPNTWHEDPVLGEEVPDDRSMWLTFIRWAPAMYGGRPWRDREAETRQQQQPEGLYRRPVRSLDEANIHQPYNAWAGALNEDDQTRRF